MELLLGSTSYKYRNISSTCYDGLTESLNMQCKFITFFFYRFQLKLQNQNLQEIFIDYAEVVKYGIHFMLYSALPCSTIVQFTDLFKINTDN